MKKYYLVAIAWISVFSIVSCTKNGGSEKPDTNAEQKPIEISVAVSNSTTKFAFDFFKTLQTDPQANENVFVSPLSLHMALGMLVNGATDETRAEIMKALKAENISQSELNDAYLKLLEELPQADPKVKLGLANSIWYRNTFSVQPDFISSLKTYFKAQITGLPFVQSDINIINKWASDNTNGRIDNVIQEIKFEDIMFLMNALYFKGDWTAQFDAKNTKNQTFYLEGGATKTVQMMNQTDQFDYTSMEDFEAVQMPYGNKQFSATIILPKAGSTLESVFNNLNSDKWNSLQNNFSAQEVAMGVPKFTLEQEFQLQATLQKMGMLKAFTPGAQLNGINPIFKPLFVNFVKQNTFVAVDEVGTEAAAVTTIGVGTTAAPLTKPFICNRPFGFIISEKTSNTILFMGRIMSPQSN